MFLNHHKVIALPCILKIKDSSHIVNVPLWYEYNAAQCCTTKAENNDGPPLSPYSFSGGRKRERERGSIRISIMCAIPYTYKYRKKAKGREEWYDNFFCKHPSTNTCCRASDRTAVRCTNRQEGTLGFFLLLSFTLCCVTVRVIPIHPAEKKGACYSNSIQMRERVNETWLIEINGLFDC